MHRLRLSRVSVFIALIRHLSRCSSFHHCVMSIVVVLVGMLLLMPFNNVCVDIMNDAIIR